ncbi:MAG: DNA-binding protein [Deltaproteobacteria bacterium]|nr:DNA-binding protein [Deltaproteobacteria bacterium]
MQKVVTFEKVAFACAKLQQEGERITGRTVLAVTGGNFGSVLKYIKQWKEQNEDCVKVSDKLPEKLQEAIVQALWQAGQDAVVETQERINQISASEKEAVEALCQSEENIGLLQEQLEQEREISATRIHQFETEVALTEEKLRAVNDDNQSLRADVGEKNNQLETLRIQFAEMKQVAKCGEAAVLKVEEKMEQMQLKMESLTQKNFELQKQGVIDAQKLKFLHERNGFGGDL